MVVGLVLFAVSSLACKLPAGSEVCRVLAQLVLQEGRKEREGAERREGGQGGISPVAS